MTDFLRPAADLYASGQPTPEDLTALEQERVRTIASSIAAGEKCFVDYAEQTAEVIDRYSGEIRSAQIFVAVLGCSNYTYAEATWTQTLPDWLGAHVRALEFFGGAPRHDPPSPAPPHEYRRIAF